MATLPPLEQYTSAGGQYAGGIVGVIQGVNTTPMLPSGTTLPTTPEGNVVAPPNVGVPATPPPVISPGPIVEPPHEQTFWEEHGSTVTAGLAVVGVAALAAYVLGKVRS